MNNLRKHHVTSGSYYISRNTALILQAFLGTCVGVALYDEEADVGGLIHLLLPEPASEGSSFQPGKYASTGFPIFLRALYDEGASKNRLKAFIAGGALVGPLASRDLHLDIGGRTVETVMRSMEEIQPIPQVALKILRLINEEEHDIKELTEEIRQDQVICAKTLKFCNSAVFGCIKKIESLENALAFLGFKNLVKLAISTLMGNFYGRSDAGYSLCKGGLYHHAVGTAIISEKLANLTAKVKPGLAFTAGLLHDIGKVVLDQYIASAYPLFYRQLFEEETDFSAAEKTNLGIDHTQVGGDLAVRWFLPDSLIDTIRHHHKPENALRNFELTYIVYLADLLMSRFHAGLELERLSTETLSTKLGTIGFSTEKFSDIVDLIPAGVFKSEPELALTK